jgi:mercuric reductase
MDEHALPATAIRPDVMFPDWTVIRSNTARNALLAILGDFRLDKCWRNYSPDKDRLRSNIIQYFASTGYAPRLDDLRSLTGMADDVITGLLEQLHRRDLVVIDAGRLVGAYPLTDRQTDHEVEIARASVHAMCAVDALGVGAMLGEDVKIASICRHCRTPIRLGTRAAGSELAAASPADTIVWSGVRTDAGCAADTLCTTIAFFCSDPHLRAWRDQHHPGTQGYRLSLDEALQIGHAIFGPTLRGVAAQTATSS